MRNIYFVLFVVCWIAGCNVNLLAQTPTITPTPFPTPIVDCLCSASGIVTDATTGEKIGNAIIAGGGEIAYTMANGSYFWVNSEFPCNDEGTYILTASAENYIAQSKTVTVTPCIDKTLNFELSPEPTPITDCFAISIAISPKRLILQRGQSSDVTVTLEGDNCTPEGETVTATIGKAGNKRISVSPTSGTTDSNGQASFTITAKNKAGNARVTFKAGSVKKSIVVHVAKNQ